MVTRTREHPPQISRGLLRAYQRAHSSERRHERNDQLVAVKHGGGEQPEQPRFGHAPHHVKVRGHGAAPAGAVTEFPLCDQEVMLRHLHTVARQYVADHQDAVSETPVRVSAAS